MSITPSPAVAFYPVPENVGLIIRAAYLEAGLNRLQFSKKCGLGYKAVFNWERGAKTPSMASLQKAATVVGKTVEQLLRITPAAAPEQDLRFKEARALEPGKAPKRERKPQLADRMWQEFLVTAPELVKLFTPQELEEIRGIRFRDGAPGSPSFYRFIAQARLEHRAGRDLAEALDCEDITPKSDPNDSMTLQWPPTDNWPFGD